MLIIAVLSLVATKTAENCSSSSGAPGKLLNGTLTFPAMPAPRLVPFPISLRARAAYLPLQRIPIHVGSKDLISLGQLLASEVLAATSGAVVLPVTAEPTAGAAASPAIVISLAPSGNSNGNAEAYTLNITATSAALSASTYAGLVAGTATLLQSVEFSGNVDAVPRTRNNCTTAPVWRLPALVIADEPALRYRGIMVDAARAYLPLSALKGFVVLCRLYKLNYMHIHMTDDGAFTWPSTAYPELAAKSPWRYNLTELHELNAFATLRGVAIIGEMDVPGHAASMVKSLPDVFGFPSKPTVGIINFVNASVVKAVQTIFDEIAAVFPSTPYVHMGGDEVNFGEINSLPEIAAALKRANVSTVTDLYRLFIGEMDVYAKLKEKTLQVWEGFKSNSLNDEGGAGPPVPSSVTVSTDIVVSPFDCNIYTPPDLAKDGYSIINSAWTPLYIAGHGRDGMHHPLPPELVYRWNPLLFGSVIHALEWWQIPDEHADAVIGAQMCTYVFFV